MTPQLNHLIVWSRDRHAAAGTFADVMGMEPPTELGHFTQVEAGNGVLLDFADTNAEPGGMHLAFLVTERQFDEIFDRITERAIPVLGRPSPEGTGTDQPSGWRARRLLRRCVHQRRVGDHHPALRLRSEKPVKRHESGCPSPARSSDIQTVLSDR